MITRFPGLTPTRSRAVATDNLVFTVAVAPDPCPPAVYEQAVKDPSVNLKERKRQRRLSILCSR